MMSTGLSAPPHPPTAINHPTLPQLPKPQELNQQGLYVTHVHQQQTHHQQKQQQQQQQRVLTWIPGRGDAAAAAAAVGAANSTTTAPVADTGGGAPASLRARALTLSRALDALGPVRVSSDRLLVPAEYLRAALQQCMLVTLSDLLAEDEVWASTACLLLLLLPCFPQLHQDNTLNQTTAASPSPPLTTPHPPSLPLTPLHSPSSPVLPLLRRCHQCRLPLNAAWVTYCLQALSCSRACAWM